MLIYLVRCKVNNKVYVGQTTRTLELRWRGHIKSAAKKSKAYFHCAIRKFGQDAFTLKLLCNCKTQVDLNNKEKIYIKKYRANEKLFGYNLTPGGCLADLYGNPAARKRQIAKLKKAWQNLDRVKTTSEYTKAQWRDTNFRKHVTKIIGDKNRARAKDPKFIELCRNNGNKQGNDPANIERFRRMAKRLWRDPVYREKMRVIVSRSSKASWRSPKFRLKHKISMLRVSKKLSAASKARWADQRYKASMLRKMNAASKRPEVKKRRSEATKKLWQNPAVRKKLMRGKRQNGIRLWKDPVYRKKITALAKEGQLRRWARIKAER